MEEKKTDLLHKGAIIQRDYDTYAIAPHLPGGICTPQVLRKIADVAEKFGAKALKLTSAQRIAIVGIKPEDLDQVWSDLGMEPGAAIGLCVRSIKFCPGTTFCKRGTMDSVGMGMKLDEKYHGMPLPSKFKIGVSGCPNSCGESWIKDLGLIGTAKGWWIVVGGSAGATPSIAQVCIKGVDDQRALDIIERIITFYKQHDKKERLGKMIARRGGIDIFKKEVGLE
ncbi:MAG: NAD(P)/FAD-dependent oxidoreductase [bacterium]